MATSGDPLHISNFNIPTNSPPRQRHVALNLHTNGALPGAGGAARAARANDDEDEDPFVALATTPALKLRLELWKKEEEVVNQRIERKEQRLQNTKNEIYQLLGIYFVFQGVILTALAQATNLTRSRLWIPFVLSLLASLASILALWYKLADCSELEEQIRDEKRHAKALYKASDSLKSMGMNYRAQDFTLQPVLPSLASAQQQQRTESFFRRQWNSHMRVYGASVIVILVIFSGIMAASCLIIYKDCPPCKDKP